MNILILYDSSDPVKFENLDKYFQKYRVILHKLGHYVKICNLKYFLDADDINKINIHYILKNLDETDLLVFVSPIFNGRFTELMMKVQTSIFDYLTFILKDNSYTDRFNETKFKIPNLGVITEFDSDNNKQEQLLCRLTMETNAAKFYTLLSFFITISASHSEAVDETLKSLGKQKSSYLYLMNEGNTVNN